MPLLTQAPVKTNLESPTGPKLKRKVSAEPTMTFHTRAATDEIYDIFNQPLNNASAQEEDEETHIFSEEDDDYTSAGESTGTGRISAPSEAGDVDDADETESKSVSEWSDFTARKHLPKLDELADDTDKLSVNTRNDDYDTREVEPEQEEDFTQHSTASDNPEISEAFSPECVAVRTKFIPIPPEDYEAPTQPFRDAVQASQNRLPFMTPIVEKTESSILPTTAHQPKEDFFDAKTPCRSKDERPSTPKIAGSDELWSSPFQEIINEAVPDRQIPQPALTKLVKSKPAKPAPSISKALPGIKDVPAKGPIIKEMQCNPVDETIRRTILENLNPPLSSYDGFFDRRPVTYNKSTELQKYTRAVAKATDKSSLPSAPVLRFDGTPREYTLKRELGKGAFAPVYLVKTSLPSSSTTNDEDEPEQAPKMGEGAFSLHPRTSALEAIKTESPPTPWEFHILRLASRRLGVSRAADSLIHAYEMHLFADECYLMLSYREQGTLLDLVNLAKTDPSLSSSGSGESGVMDEMLAMFFAVELLRVVEALHARGIMHGDLKADNCLVRLEPVATGGAAEWATAYRPDGSAGWAAKGLSLIDFGRGIDMRAFPATVQFVADWPTTPQDPPELREMRPWTYQLDYHGVAGIVHSLLFGKYLETVAERGAAGLNAGTAGRRYATKERLKRYWQTELWEGLFGLCLNPGASVEAEEGGKMPLVRGLRRVREGMEAWLVANAERRGLKGLVRRVEERLRDRKR